VFSQRVRYALKALLSLASEEPGQAVMISSIAKQQNIPENFLALILLDLKRVGLVSSRRGRDGGYTLAKPAGDISFGQVVRSIEGPIALLPCVSESQYRRCHDCPDENSCAIRKILAKVRASTAEFLDNHTLLDALNEGQTMTRIARRARSTTVLTAPGRPREAARKTRSRKPTSA